MYYARSIGPDISFTFRTIIINKWLVCGVGAGLFDLSASFKAVGEPAPTGWL
jgi:hypothetical protein